MKITKKIEKVINVLYNVSVIKDNEMYLYNTNPASETGWMRVTEEMVSEAKKALKQGLEI